MTDRKKVIRGLECCVETQESMEWEDCSKCPYDGKEHCSNILMIDALAILKEQEETDAVINPCGSCQEWTCDDCEYAEKVVRWNE